MNQDDLVHQPQKQQQIAGDIQVQGDGNCFNIIQGDASTSNQIEMKSKPES